MTDSPLQSVYQDRLGHQGRVYTPGYRILCNATVAREEREREREREEREEREREERESETCTQVDILD